MITTGWHLRPIHAHPDQSRPTPQAPPPIPSSTTQHHQHSALPAHRCGTRTLEHGRRASLPRNYARALGAGGLAPPRTLPARTPRDQHPRRCPAPRYPPSLPAPPRQDRGTSTGAGTEAGAGAGAGDGRRGVEAEAEAEAGAVVLTARDPPQGGLPQDGHYRSRKEETRHDHHQHTHQRRHHGAPRGRDRAPQPHPPPRHRRAITGQAPATHAHPTTHLIVAACSNRSRDGVPGRQHTPAPPPNPQSLPARTATETAPESATHPRPTTLTASSLHGRTVTETMPRVGKAGPARRSVGARSNRNPQRRFEISEVPRHSPPLARSNRTRDGTQGRHPPGSTTRLIIAARPNYNRDGAQSRQPTPGPPLRPCPPEPQSEALLGIGKLPRPVPLRRCLLEPQTRCSSDPAMHARPTTPSAPPEPQPKARLRNRRSTPPRCTPPHWRARTKTETAFKAATDPGPPPTSSSPPV
ncbi:hypothetical protein SAMN05216270_104168 [Glycomyces harbinensis]|uniref:Uncharacterized protein n=1 Tax=Glycomyces harbinensis TaxID=58114 RepID=A0A1G6V221_9ACTN|nr:hypothetical protein SAMN05216270_104168 [Glycomyces harbinensis]